MIQMDANSKKLGNETRDMRYSLHNNSALLHFNISFIKKRFLTSLCFRT